MKGLESRHGGGKKDIAALFTYAVLDHFVKDGGTLALVVHVSLFKTSGAGEGYRRFQLGSGEHFAIEEAHDFQRFQPFLTHPKMKIKTRTLTFRALKGKQTSYPVPYTVWTKTQPGIVPGNLTWEEAEKRLASSPMKAMPLRGTSRDRRLSPWLTVPSCDIPLCRKVIAPTRYDPHYVGREGINSLGLNGAFFIELLDRLPNGTVLIRNMHDVGKIECPPVKATIEADLVYPLLRGRSIARWRYESAGHVLIVQDPKTQRGYPEEWMQETHPLTWVYLKKFEALLRERKGFKKFFNPEKDPFYSMYAVTEHTFARHKVLWMDVSATMKAVVLSGRPGRDTPVAEHKLMFLTTQTEDEAHYVAAVLNSGPVNTVVTGYIVDNCVSTSPIENIVIPQYDPKDKAHAELAALSKAAHEATAKTDDHAVERIQKAIDKAVGNLW